jgi:hypothetical protein
METVIGYLPSLPRYVEGVCRDGLEGPRVRVLWPMPTDNSQILESGSYVVTGQVAGTDFQPKSNITVKAIEKNDTPNPKLEVFELDQVSLNSDVHYNPDFHLLQEGYGGLLGAISNITQDGLGPTAFHSFPSTLRIDYLSGDYGSGFFGYAVNTVNYITKNEDLGWLAFGGNLETEGDVIKVELTTAAKNRIYIAPRKLWLTLDAGSFEKVFYNKRTGEVENVLKTRNEFTPTAFLRSNEELELNFERVRGSYMIPLKENKVKLKF